MTSGVTSASSGSLVDPEPRSATQSPTLWESNHLLSSTLECGNTDHVLHNGYQSRRLVGRGSLVGFTSLVSVSVSESVSLSQYASVSICICICMSVSHFMAFNLPNL